MSRIATMSGTFITPGVSGNGRLYTQSTIARAVERMQRRLEHGDNLPITMLSHHDAKDDSLRIVGRVTEAGTTPDGSGTFTADIPDTAAGRDIAALVSGDTPYLGNVSIRGAWLGNVRREAVEGWDGQVETADDLEIDGVDFTKSPGVAGARIQSVTHEALVAAHATETAPRTPITESVDVALNVTPATEVETKETTVPENKPAPTTEQPATETQQAPARNFTDADVQAIVAALGEQKTAPPTETSETKSEPTSISEAVAKATADLKESIVNELREQLVNEGVIRRKGLVRESEQPQKAPHEMTDEEFRAYSREQFDQMFPTPVAGAAD